jgi:hypothetical protein
VKKLCIIGNSHVAPLKNAWTGLSALNSDIELSFFAAPGDEIQFLQIADGVLVPTTERLAAQLRFTSGGQSYIDFDLFDAVVLCGLHLRAYRKRPGHVSRAAQKVALSDHITNTMFWSALGMIRNLSSIPVYALHNPLLARVTSEHEIPRSDLYEEGMALLMGYEGFDGRTVVLKQPTETICSGFFTNFIYTAGAPKLLETDSVPDDRYPHGDLRHMNEAYGRILFENYLPIFRGTA